MIVDQINNSPFVTKEFLNLVIQLNSSSDSDLQHDLFSIKDGTLCNSGSRDYIDYRPNFNLTSKSLKDLNCKKVSLDSMHFDQIKEISKLYPENSLKISKQDQVVNLMLPESYEEYLAALPRKKRHELKRKKVRFQEKYPQAVLRESKDSEIFESFITLHKTSDGDKGNFMNDEVTAFFSSLLTMKGWKIYYLEVDNAIAACCFVYEDEVGSYLYNSSKNNTFNEVNPGIIIIDKIIEQLISKEFTFFDFLKGTERYKFDLGGISTQLYDIEITL
ncbi:MAG: GNAT family N-acetyltransferase [Actinobacteria bacterium]|nr:GNAT family N-acetyltransferase [Actinomycetota bacterium]